MWTGLRTRLLAGLVIIATLITAGFVTVERGLKGAEHSSHVVNLAGRQRMLTTRVDALVTRLALPGDQTAGAEVRSEIKGTLEHLYRVHVALIEGDPALGLKGSDDAAVRAIYQEAPYRLDAALQSYLGRVRAYLEANAEDRAKAAEALPALWPERDRLVAGFEALTQAFERAGQARVEAVHWADRTIFALLIASLVGIWLFNFRPMERRIAREQATLRGITENVAEAIVTIDRDGHVHSCNPAAEGIFGYPEPELRGHHVGVLVAGNDRAAFDGLIQDRFAPAGEDAPEAGPREFTGIDSRGGTVPLEVSLGSMRVDGRTLLIAVMRDISERKRAERDLKLSRDRMEVFVRHTPAAVAMFDREMRYILHSERWRSDYGLGDIPVMGRSHYELFPEIPERWRAIHRRCLEGAVERCDEDPFERANGEVEWVRWEIHPWYEDEEVGGIIMFTEVITARKRAESELNARNRAVEAASCGILITDTRERDYAITYINPEFERITGYGEDDALGRNCRFLRGDDPEQEGLDTLREAVAAERPVTVLLRNYRKDGTLFWNQAAIAPVRDDQGEVVNFVGIITDVSERMESEEALRRSEARYRSLYNDTPVMLHSIDPEGRLIAVSDFWLRKLGYRREEVLGRPSTDFLTDATRVFAANEVLPAFFETGHCEAVPYTFVHKDGSEIQVELSAIADYDESGHIARSLAVIVDVTDKKHAEEQLRQMQKLDAVGMLTGGIAHDFNNLLAVILGNLQLIERRAREETRVLPLVKSALDSANRGAELTGKLLAFARRQTLAPAPTDVNELVAGMESLFRRTLGKNINVETRLEEGLARVMADSTQLESALLNLAVNARDAMPDGGRLLFETRDVELDERYARTHPHVSPGHFVMIAVTDTGTGIPAEIRERIFEPFYTTKGVGKGTGLGLSMVYGFAKQSHGDLQVYSEPGQGTTFRIYLPRLAEPAAADTTERATRPDVDLGVGQKVLLVEDEAPVRETHAMLVEELGYQVVTAGDGREALECLRADPDIGLLFSDVVMAGGLSGPQLAEQARTLRPGLRVLLTSGHPWDHLPDGGERYPFLSKPFSDQLLAETLTSLFRADTPVASG